MLKRKITTVIEHFYEVNKGALLLAGARQIGKTYSIRKFAEKHFESFIEINFVDTPENYRKRYYKGELPRKNTFEGRKLTSEPKFVQKRRQYADNQDNCKGLSTFEKEIPEKS